MAEYIELPVNPERLCVERQSNNKSYSLLGTGEVSVLGPALAARVQLESFFPAEGSYFAEGKRLSCSPAECVERINSWRASLQPIRLTVCEGAKDLSLACSIERFDYWESWGESGDIYFLLVLKEYRWFKLQQANKTVSSTAQKGSSAYLQKTEERKNERQLAASYTVRSGDSLWRICQSKLGDGSRYREIAALNKLANPNLLKVGQVIRLQ